MTGHSTTSSQVEPIPLERAGEIWPLAERELRRGLAYHPGQTLDDMRADVLNGTAQIWKIWQGKAWCVVTILHYQRRKVLLVYGVAGEGMRLWRRILTDALETYALQVGADTIRCFTYDRFAKVLERAGWSRAARVMERYLNE